MTELQYILFLIVLVMVPSLLSIYMVIRVFKKYDHVRNNQPTKGK